MTTNPNKMLQEHEALLKTIYESRNPTRRYLHNIRRDWIIQTLKYWAQQKGMQNVLEVGGGCGIFIPDLVRLFKAVTVSDVEEAFLAIVGGMKKHYPNITIIKDDIVRTQLPKNSFDLILCSEVIEHISDSSKAIQSMFELLKTKGVLVLSTPQKYSTIEMISKIVFLPGIIQIAQLIYREPVYNTGHINLLTSKQVIKQCETAGFKILQSHKAGLYLPLIAELLGKWGLNIEKWLASKIRGTVFENFLWTQYYVFQK
jgi:2-polyprenyl-3-methyl-5-hydroxy-6-metoxy-1,4-benzoquinol methylase